MNNTPPHSQPMLLRLAQRLYRVWIALLVGVVCVPMATLAWYYVQHHRANASGETRVSVQTPSTDVAVATVITITFSQPMDTQQVATQLTVYPVHPYTLAWNSSNTTVRVIPSTPWSPATSYTISLATPRDNTTPWWQWQFSTAPGVNISHTVPSNGSNAVASTDIIVVRFSQAMVPQSLVHTPVANTVLQLTPAVSGVFMWVDQYTATLRPTTLTLNTRYTARIFDDVRDLVGRSLTTPYQWQFQTLAPQLTLVTPRDSERFMALTSPIVLTATGVIDQQALRDSIIIRPALSTRIDISSGNNDTTQITITPQPAWQVDARYQLQIGGGTTQFALQQHVFTTAPALRLVARSPGEGQLIQPNQDVRFIFNTDIDRRTLTDSVRLTPAPLRPAVITSSGRDIRIQAQWAPGIQPEIRINELLLSSSGITLGTVLTSQLMFDNHTSQIVLPATTDAVIDASTTLQLALTSTNISQLVVQIYDLAPSALVRILGMDATSLAMIEPTRYDLPLLSELTFETPRQMSQITIPRDIRERSQSNVVLFIASDSQQHRQVRLVRIRPTSLQVTTLAGYVAVGSTDTAPIELFSNGQLIEQGQLNDTGIWQSQQYVAGGTFIVLTNTTPSDAVRVVLPPVTGNPQHVAMLSDTTTAVPGARVSVALARNNDHQFTQVVPIGLCRSDGVVLSSQNVIFAPGQTLTHGILTIPGQLAYGTYHVCVNTTDMSATIPLIVHAPLGERLRLQVLRDNTTIRGRLSDAATHAIQDATVYWVQGDTMGSVTTTIDGTFYLPATDPAIPLTVVAVYQGESQVVTSNAIPTRTLVISGMRTWVKPGEYSTLALQINDPNQQDLVRRIQVVVTNATGYVATRQSIRTDAQGQAVLTLAIPRGRWMIEASDGIITQTAPLYVGSTPDDALLAAQMPLVPTAPIQLWYGESNARSILMTQHDSTGTTTRWAPLVQGIITTTLPLTSPFVQVTVPWSNGRMGMLDAPVQISDCTVFRATTGVVQDGVIPITVTTTPDSMIALRLSDKTSAHTVAWQSMVTSDATGNAVIQVPDDGQTRAVRLDAIVSRPFCSQNHHTDLSIQRTHYLRLDAPAHVRIGDEVVVTLTLNTQRADLPTQITAAITNAVMLSQPATTTATSDTTMQWRIQITHPLPQFVLLTHTGTTVTWHPVVDDIMPTERNDGFFLEGRTRINYDTPAPMIDVLRTQYDVIRALRTDPVDIQNPSQLAHLIWLSNEADERTRLLALLSAMRGDMPGWGWDNTARPDALLTADVVSALTLAEVPRAFYHDALPFLQSQLDNATLPPTTQILVIRALVLNDEPYPSAFATFVQQPALLGNEGLAALLDILPADHAYRIPTILNTLWERRHQVPRGNYWDTDPATHMLHTQNSVNALILQAFTRISVNNDIQQTVINYLMSTRGVAGWGDTITNARMWGLRDRVFTLLTGNQRSDIQLLPDQIQRNTAIWPAQSIADDVTIQSDAPVLVGISQPTDRTPARNDMILQRSFTLLDGTPLHAESQLKVNDYVNVTLDIVTFTAMNYLTLSDPLIQLGQIESITSPREFHVIVDQHNQLVLYGNTPRAGIWRCQYRIRITNAGRVSIPAAVASDAAGTIHARSQPAIIVVTTP